VKGVSVRSSHIRASSDVPLVIVYFFNTSNCVLKYLIWTFAESQHKLAMPCLLSNIYRTWRCQSIYKFHNNNNKRQSNTPMTSDILASKTSPLTFNMLARLFLIWIFLEWFELGIVL
jgi:hypothetical protein